MPSSRRQWLRQVAPVCLAVPAWLGGCASIGIRPSGDEEVGGHPDGDAGTIVDAATGRRLSRAAVIALARRCDYLLLGELHDNPLHHRLRGELLQALGPQTAVVAEQMTWPDVARLPPDADTAALLAALQAAGFDARAWRWPLHEPLFAAIARTGQRLAGADLDRPAVRAVARDSLSALAPPLRAIADATPLSPTALAALERDLVEGHCGQLPAARLPAMVAVQRARDATMARALQEARTAMAAAGQAASVPAVLVAGNGHVRRDYGVGHVLAAIEPRTRTLTIGFVETDDPKIGATGTDAGTPAVDLLWIAPPAARDDPCAQLASPLPADGARAPDAARPASAPSAPSPVSAPAAPSAIPRD